MARDATPALAGPESFLNAVRDTGQSLRRKYEGNPEELAKRLGLLLPEKPLQVMKQLGLYDPVKHGPIEPGIRDLVLDVCLGLVDSAVAVAARGAGKAISISTPIPTPRGWTTMGALEEGSEVFAPDGTVTTVIDAWPIYEGHECYELEFGDGSTIVADSEHKWYVRRSWGAECVLTTQELYGDHLDYRGGTKWLVDSTLPLLLPESALPIDPYFLGYWLGDGDSTQAMLCIGKEDIDDVERILEERGHYGQRISDQNDNYRLRYTLYHRVLRAMGMLGDKHIPRLYKRASVQQRLDLLAGLMDSDGTISNRSNQCVLAVQSEALALGCAELVASLGWKYTMRKREVGPDWNRAISYMVSFRPTQQIFKVSRKANRLDLLVAQTSRHTSRSIRKVRPVPSVPVRCIAVDHPSRLFLAGKQMVPTHNSQGVSFIEFYLVFVEKFDALNLGGSELQADQVYQYLLSYIDSDPYWLKLVKGDPMRERTYTIDEAWIRVLTASGKSVRSPHAGGYKAKTKRWAGGILVIDEEAEAERDIVEAALPTINTAKPSVNIRSSTFHNVVGSFADVVENHEEMGYKLYRWDLIDVCSGCECGPDACENVEKCFREDHIETHVDPNTGEEVQKLVHRAYCGGRARYARGWVSMEEILKLWRRMNRNHSRFEVEGMGWRPTTSGHVIRDQQAFNNNTTHLTGKELYLPGCPVSIVVDWGTVAAGFEVWQLHFNGKHALIECEELAENTPTQIESKIVTTYKKYINDSPEVAADIGGGGNYMNARLEEVYGIPVRGVNFNEDKEAAVAVWNIFNEGEHCVYPEEFRDFNRQAKKWKRKNGKIQKGDDHLCDAAVCYFSKYIDDLGIERVRVAPQAFSSATQVPDYGTQRQSSESSNTGRAPVMFPLRGR